MNQYSFLLKSLLPILVISTTSSAVSAQITPSSSAVAQLPKKQLQQREQAMNQKDAQRLIETFYTLFNAKDLDKLYALIDDNIEFAMNEDQPEKGKAAFIKMMQQVTTDYHEQVDNVIYMLSADGKNVATTFHFKGKYVHTDASQIPATGQTYANNAFNYFEVHNNKIIKAIGFYNHAQWLKQVSGK